MLFRDGVKRTSLQAIGHDYEKNCGRVEGSGEAISRGNEEGVDLGVLLGKDLLWAKAANAGDVTEESVVATRNVFTAVDHEMPVSEKGYVEFLCSSSTEVLSARLKSEAEARNLADQVARVEQLELKVKLLADDGGNVGDL